MPTPTGAKEPLIETLPLEERIRRRANELYVERGNRKRLENLSLPAIRQPIRSI